MLIIFDCDGVVVDSERIALEVLSDMMGEFSHPMSVEECRDAFMGRHNADIVRGIETRVGRALPGEGQRIRARMIARLRNELKPVRGVAAALGQLDDRLCIASSSDPERILLTLELTKLSNFFSGAIFSGVDVPKGKPAPDLFLHAAASMGESPENCVVVEDSVQGVCAGVAANMPVIGFTGGSHTDPGHAARLTAAGATIVIAAMEDLPATIARFRRPEVPRLAHGAANAR